MTTYKVRTGDPRILWAELNRIFELISDRLDKIEGFRGNPEFYSIVESNDDVVVMSGERGLVLADNGDPTNYWRIGISRTGTTGTLTAVNLGREYK